MTTSRKRVAKKVTASRTAQLEEKLDDLVSILRATQSSNQLTPPSAPTSSFAASSSMALTSRLDSLAAAATSSTSQSLPSLMSSSIPNAFGHANSAEPASITSAAPDINETYQLPEPTPAEAEIYFSKFREWLKNFPFMILSPGTTAASLREERPFLWLAIMNITTMSAPQQLLMKERVREEVATRVIINHERTMDVLLGLITYLAWYAVLCS